MALAQQQKPGVASEGEKLVTLSNGTRLNVLEEGQGPAIVLMHGWTADLHFWDDLTPRLIADGWRVIRFDLRGHGRSPVQGPYSFPALSDDLRHLLSKLGLKSPVLAGLSLGGFLAMIHAIENPRSARAVILADTWTAPVASDAEIVATLPASADGPEALAQWWVERRGGGAAAVARDPVLTAKRNRFATLSADGLRHAIGACLGRPSVHDRLDRIDVPALVIAGENDHVFSPAMHAEMAAAIAGAKLVVIPRAGHHSATDAPEEFAEAVRGFLAALPPDHQAD